MSFFSSNIFRQKIGCRLLLYILLFSGVVTLMITATQLAIEYSRDRQVIDDQLARIEKIFIPPLTQALWFFNESSRDVQLEEISRLRDIEYLELVGENDISITVGEKISQHTVEKTLPLIYKNDNVEREIGSLTVIASITNVYSRLFDRMMTIFISEGIKIFLISTFIFLIFHSLVIRFLTVIENYLKNLDFNAPPHLLELPRKSKPNDELDQMVSSINEMTTKLYTSYGEIKSELLMKKSADGNLQKAYDEIETTIAERTIALEKAIQQLTTEVQERKKTEISLRESEERFKAIHDASFGGICIHDNGLILECNQGLADMTGFTRAELIGMDGLKLIAPSGLDLVLMNIKSGYEKGYEVEGVRQDGSVYPLAIRGKNVLYQGRQVRVIEFRDITERKLAENAVRESEDRFRLIFMTTPDPVIIISAKNGVVIDVNKAFEIKVGIKRHAAIGQTAEDVDLWEDSRQRGIFWDQLIKDGEVNNFEFKLKLHNGEIRSCLLSARLLKLSSEVCILAVIRDITTEKVAEQTLLGMSKIKSEFISTAAHELRTPLSAIMGFTELMLDPELSRGFSDEQKQEHLNDIYSRGEALNRLIDDLLDISRIENGKPIPLNRENTHLGKLLTKAVKYFKFSCSKHTFLLDVPEDSAQRMLMIDRHRITQATENLLSNAVKYSPENTCISVTGVAGADGWTVKIEDKGIGMTPEQLSHVFEQFYRVNSSDTAIGGLGLGMGIVKQIIEVHGGSIWLESVAGEGTIVTFSLPYSTDVA